MLERGSPLPQRGGRWFGPVGAMPFIVHSRYGALFVWGQFGFGWASPESPQRGGGTGLEPRGVAMDPGPFMWPQGPALSLTLHATHQRGP